MVYKYLLPILLSVIGTTLQNFKIHKELACGHMGPYQSFKLPNVVYTKKSWKTILDCKYVGMYGPVTLILKLP